MLSKTSTQLIAIVLLAGLLPGAKADCYIDDNGYETCDGLSNLARALIGLAFFLVFLGILFSLFAFRRRRNRRANLAYIQQVQPGTGAYGGSPPFAPQYPPPAHNGLNYNYDPSSGFAPPTGAPPQYYAPPPGAPPFSSPK